MLALAKIGRNDVAYRLVRNDTFPWWWLSPSLGIVIGVFGKCFACVGRFDTDGIKDNHFRQPDKLPASQNTPRHA